MSPKLHEEDKQTYKDGWRQHKVENKIMETYLHSERVKDQMQDTKDSLASSNASSKREVGRRK